MVKVEISRYSPEKDTEPHLQTFVLPLEKGDTVLGLLNYIRNNLDESIAYKAYCTNEHCGECGIRINGNPVLACREKISADHLVLEPLARFKVIKDLVADIDAPARRLWATLPSLAGGQKNPDIIDEKAHDVFFMAGRCNGCFLCQSTCSLFSADQEFISGPAAYVNLAQYLLRVDNHDDDLNKLLLTVIKHNLLKCSLCGNCTKTCPRAINPMEVILEILKLIKENTNIQIDSQAPLIKAVEMKAK